MNDRCKAGALASVVLLTLIFHQTTGGITEPFPVASLAPKLAPAPATEERAPPRKTALPADSAHPGNTALPEGLALQEHIGFPGRTAHPQHAALSGDHAHQEYTAAPKPTSDSRHDMHKFTGLQSRRPPGVNCSLSCVFALFMHGEWLFLVTWIGMIMLPLIKTPYRSMRVVQCFDNVNGSESSCRDGKAS